MSAIIIEEDHVRRELVELLGFIHDLSSTEIQGRIQDFSVGFSFV